MLLVFNSVTLNSPSPSMNMMHPSCFSCLNEHAILTCSLTSQNPYGRHPASHFSSQYSCLYLDLNGYSLFPMWPCSLGDISESVLFPHPNSQQRPPTAVFPMTGSEGACLSIGSVCLICPDNCHLHFTMFFTCILLLSALGD